MTQYLEVDDMDRVFTMRSSPVEAGVLDAHLRQEPYEGALDADTVASSQTFYVLKNGEVIDSGQPRLAPIDGMSWDKASATWVDDRPIVDKRADKWAEIKAVRDSKEFGQLEYSGNLFDIDEVSQRRIQGAVQLAAMDPTLSLTWTTATNTVVTMTAADFVGLGGALGTHVATVHAIAQGLRATIDAASTVAELEAIQWPE